MSLKTPNNNSCIKYDSLGVTLSMKFSAVTSAYNTQNPLLLQQIWRTER